MKGHDTLAASLTSCSKEMAPTLKKVEDAYADRVNFVMIDGDSSKNADLVDAFRVDGIPHMALISAKGEVVTALIGAAPKEVVVADLNALLANKDLPYAGLDVFAGSDHN